MQAQSLQRQVQRDMNTTQLETDPKTGKENRTEDIKMLMRGEAPGGKLRLISSKSSATSLVSIRRSDRSWKSLQALMKYAESSPVHDTEFHSPFF